MTMITVEKDEETGIIQIFTKKIALKKFQSIDDPREMFSKGINEVFELGYLESDDGVGQLVINLWSFVSSLSERKVSPKWESFWPIIIDGEKVSLAALIESKFDEPFEGISYLLPVDILLKICNAKEIKYSLRGKNIKVEGVFSSQHLMLFKAFEQYCFGDENEGKKIIDNQLNINKSFNSKSDNKVLETNNQQYLSIELEKEDIKPDIKKIPNKNIIDDDIDIHERKVVALLNDNKVKDAIKYYESIFEISENSAKKKIKKIAAKNGIFSIYDDYETKTDSSGFSTNETILGLAVLLFLAFMIYFTKDKI